MRRMSWCHIHSSTMVRIVSAMSGNLTEKLDWDLVKCGWFSIQCNESLDSSSTLKVIMFIPMLFDDSPQKKSSWHYCHWRQQQGELAPLMRWRGLLWRKRYLWKNWCRWLKTGFAPWWANVQALQSRGDTDSAKFWHYHHHSSGNLYKIGQLLSCDDSNFKIFGILQNE